MGDGEEGEGLAGAAWPVECGVNMFALLLHCAILMFFCAILLLNFITLLIHFIRIAFAQYNVAFGLDSG